MADSRRIVKVFLASPGDLTEERKAAKAVVDEFNALTADDFGYQVELVGWEDTVSVYGRPQETINKDLERCELFIGLMWKKWGTPPDKVGRFSSGFEEEFETSVARRRKSDSPEISLLFKDIDSAFFGDPGPDLKRVVEFKKKLAAEKEIMYQGFSDLRDFEKKFNRCIWNYVRSVKDRERAGVTLQNQAPTTLPDESDKSEEKDKSERETPLSKEGANFLRDFVQKTERTTNEDLVTAAEIARFRLLSGLVRDEANDERLLGVHDSNLLLAHSQEFEFGGAEIDGLVAAGLTNFADENTPLWYWIDKVDGFSRGYLANHTVIAKNAKVRVGALTAMRVIAEPIDGGDRENFLKLWLAKNVAVDARVAALDYLAEYGIESDLPAIRAELDQGHNQTIGAAADAIIRIGYRISRERGIAALYELQPSSIGGDLVQELFRNPKKLSSQTLTRGIDHKSSLIRKTVVRLLRGRKELATDVAEKLLNDSDVDVRYEALISLVEGGRIVPEAEAKNVLVTQSRAGGLRMGGLFGLGSLADQASEDAFKRFREFRLHEMKDKELEDAASLASIFDQQAPFALVERQIKERGDQLRSQVRDQFKEMFAAAMDEMAKLHEADWMEKTRGLEKYTRKDLTHQGLEIICRHGNANDLVLVRQTLKSGLVDFSFAQLEFLRKFGDWEDVPLVVEAAERVEAGKYGVGILGASNHEKYLSAARTIYGLGKTKLAQILSLNAPGELLAFVVAESSESAFRSLSDSELLDLFLSKSDQLRKAAALKTVQAVSAGRVARILSAYLSGPQFRYYNVIHWLDMGVSVPRARARAAASRIVNKHWKASVADR